MKLEFTDITDIELDGIHTADAPDFADAFISYAWNLIADRPCTYQELDYIQDTYPETIGELVYNQYFG